MSKNIRKKLQPKTTKYSEQKPKGKPKLCSFYLNQRHLEEKEDSDHFKANKKHNIFINTYRQ